VTKSLPCPLSQTPSIAVSANALRGHYPIGTYSRVDALGFIGDTQSNSPDQNKLPVTQLRM